MIHAIESNETDWKDKHFNLGIKRRVDIVPPSLCLCSWVSIVSLDRYNCTSEMSFNTLEFLTPVKEVIHAIANVGSPRMTE